MRIGKAGALLALLSTITAVLLGQPSSSRIVLTGSLNEGDLNSLFEREFTVPAGTVALDIRVDYTAENERTVIDVGLRDPEGIRGWSGGRRDPIHLSATSATAGYRPGTIVPGSWAMILGVPNIRPGVESRYTISIDLANNNAVQPRPTLRQGAGWYVGDLHSHSGHSDGYRSDASGRRWPVAVADIASAASHAGLDFLAVSDHNTNSHWADVDLIQPMSPVLLLHAREITTYRGHVNAIGERQLTDFRIGPGRPMTSMLADAGSDGSFLSINHPWLPDDERCMGCGWIDRDRGTIAHVHGVEVGNGDPESQSAGRPFWIEMLNRGQPLVAVGGSDSHNPDARRVGVPATGVGHQNLSEDSLVAGLKSGRVYVRTVGPDRPALEFTAVGDREVPMGGTLHPGALVLRARVKGAAGQRCRWYRRGKLVKEMSIDGDEANLAWTVTAQRDDWFALDVYDGERATLISNAIYVN